MSANQSNLSSPQYGYDFVIATTQASINKAVSNFLTGSNEPEIVVCYIADEHGNPAPIDFETLKHEAGGSDPFAIPNGADPATNQDVKNLVAARFLTAFKARVGIPPELGSPQDIVTLGANAASVTFNVMCSEFQVVQYNPGGFNPPSWTNESQPSAAPWLFSSKVDLRLSPDSDFSKLPEAVQNEIKNLGGNAFGVQQLIFDLDSAALETIPTISGVDPKSNLANVLQRDFLGKYFETVKAAGLPMLGCAITDGTLDPSTLKLTDLNFEVNPYLNGSQPQLATLNYLCAANNNQLPSAVNFNWNWIDAGETNIEGVIAINRNTLARFLQSQLDGYVRQNCFQSSVRVWLSGFFDQNVHYSWSLAPGQTPGVSIPPTGATVLSYSQSSYANDSAGLGGDMGQMTLAPQYNVNVSFAGNTITIQQHLVIYLRVQVFQTSDGGNIVDRTITDNYAITVDENGNLITNLSSSSTDNSENPGSGGFLNFFTDINDIIGDVENWTRNFTQTRLASIPVSVVQNFVFPGGNQFKFTDAAFSANQDLVAHISYL